MFLVNEGRIIYRLKKNFNGNNNSSFKSFKLLRTILGLKIDWQFAQDIRKLSGSSNIRKYVENREEFVPMEKLIENKIRCTELRWTELLFEYCLYDKPLYLKDNRDKELIKKDIMLMLKNEGMIEPESWEIIQKIQEKKWFANDLFWKTIEKYHI